MAPINFVTLNSIIDRVRGELKWHDENGRIDTGDCIEYAIDAMRKIGTPYLMENKIGVVQITNNKGCLPSDIYELDLVYKLTQSEPENILSYLVNTNVSNTTTTETESTSLTTTVTQTVVTRNSSGSCGDSSGELLYLSTVNTTLDQLNLLEMGEPMYYGGTELYLLSNKALDVTVNASDSYVINKKGIVVTFSKGCVIVMYRSFYKDANCIPMVPDDIDIISAITSYIIYMIMREDFWIGREGSDVRMGKAENEWYSKRAMAANSTLISTPQDAVDKIRNRTQRRNRFKL